MTDDEKLAEKRAKDAAYHRAWRAKNKDSIRASSRRYYEANPGKMAARGRLRRYGISQDDFEAMLSEQSNACAICGTSDPGAGNASLLVDHCHDTQLVRGLLCHFCNVGLGHFKDNPERLMKAASYITQHTQEAT